MAIKYGTTSIADLIRAGNTSIIDFGVENCYDAVRLFVAAYNELLRDEMNIFVERTTERVVGMAGPATMTAIYTDEVGVPDSQKIGQPTMMGFPLRKHDVTLQWTEQWFLNHTTQELAAQANEARVADLQKVQYALRQSIFTPTNRNSTDRLRDNMIIPVKAFANADGFPIPPSPNGFNFNAGTHTHYMGTTGTSGTTLVAADVDALIQNVLEHFNGGQLYLYVSVDVEATMSNGNAGSTKNFPGYAQMVYTDVVAPIVTPYAVGNLAQSQPFNRITGRYRDAIVSVKPWMPFGTLFCFMSGQTKPIAMRVRAAIGQNQMYGEMAGGDNGDFQMIFSSMDHPLNCQIWSREYGFGVQSRIVGAVMSVGSTSYTMPSITSGATPYTV